MSRSLILITILLISIHSVLAQDLETPEPDPSYDIKNVLQGQGTTEVTEDTQVPAPPSPFSSLTVGAGTVSNDGTTTSIDYAPLGETTQGTEFRGAHDLSIEDNGDYTIGSVDHLEQGNIIITNGFNVRWNGGILTADSASSLDYKGSTSTDVVKLTADGTEFTVQKAAAVQAGCFLVEDVEIAKFVVNKNVTMTTSGDGKVVYGDGTTLNYDGLQANSSITGSVTNCMKPTYTVTAMQLSATTGNLTESINGTGQIQVDSLYGVVCVNLSPVSTYDIDTGWYEENFGFVIKDYGYKLCIQKAVAQKLVADCPLCGLVDLANRKLLLNGVIEYRRYWHDSALIEQTKQTAFKSQGFGKNVIDLQRGTVTLEKDEPPVATVPSNYLALYERDENGATHRYLGINEKIDRVAFNWMKLYATEYAPATTTIINNLLDYQRGACHVAVLPPNHAQINSMLSSLREQEVRFG